MKEKQKLNIVLTPSQQQALEKLKQFVKGDDARAFILTGYAELERPP